LAVNHLRDAHAGQDFILVKPVLALAAQQDTGYGVSWSLIPFGLWRCPGVQSSAALFGYRPPSFAVGDLPRVSTVPAELWLTCLLLPVYLFIHRKETDYRFIFHPLFVLLVIHFFWIIMTSVISSEPMISIKYTMAKAWYLVCFILVPLILFKDIREFKSWGLF
jgi:hypothetical protein